MRCNNRRFNLNRTACRKVLLYAIERAQSKYPFTLYALCIMSNHVHYLLEPEMPEDLPRIMHWLNWYSAMSFNRMLGRTGHFWEQRYHSSGFARDDHQRALNTLRYIHANPKAAGMTKGFRYSYSNYGTYDQLVDDGLTQWHPAFLQLGDTLEACAARYRAFCQRYLTPHKSGGRRSRWGVQWLPRLPRRQRDDTASAQLPLWETRCQVEPGDTPPEAVFNVADRFVQANAMLSTEVLH